MPLHSMRQEEQRLVGNGVSELLHQSILRFKQLQGSVTCFQAWTNLENDGRVSKSMLIKEQQYPHQRMLLTKLSAMADKTTTWMKELNMYPDLIGAIRDGLYKDAKDILVVNTSQHHNFQADVSVATYDDACCHTPIFWLCEPMGIRYANQEVTQRR